MKSQPSILPRPPHRLEGASGRQLDRYHPILAHIVPIRRCNLSCTYCNEYDAVSPPVPSETVLRWVDKLAALGTDFVTVSGGEPFMHPELDAIVARIREARDGGDRSSRTATTCRGSGSRG